MATPEWRDRWDELNGREKTFVERWLIDFNPHQAALDAGYSIHTARSDAWSWVKDPTLKPDLYETCAFRRKQKLDAMGEGEQARELIERLRRTALADPRELIDQQRGACRYCWGVNHEYQWKDFEYEEAVRDWERRPPKRRDEPMPELMGGMGYRFKASPNPECPRCEGEGQIRVTPRDTRDLSPSGVALYKGIKIRKDGSLEILSQDQAAAAALYAKITGIAIERRELTGPGGAPLMPTRIELVAANVDGEG